jgi:hypothetical protein
LPAANHGRERNLETEAVMKQNDAQRGAVLRAIDRKLSSGNAFEYRTEVFNLATGATGDCKTHTRNTPIEKLGDFALEISDGADSD